MSDILFLTLEQVIEIHADLIERYGGRNGIRDIGLLQSAVAMPQAGVGDQYLHADLFEMTAACLFHIIQNHPFIDGNKRTAAMVAFTFLKLNMFVLDAGDLEFEQLILDVAAGKSTKIIIADFFRKNIRR